jgi:hypothetical protein
LELHEREKKMVAYPNFHHFYSIGNLDHFELRKRVGPLYLYVVLIFFSLKSFVDEEGKNP